MKNGYIEHNIRALTAEDRDKANAFIRRQWFSTDMLIRGKIYDLTKVDGFLSLDDANNIIGLVTYIISDRICEITSMNSMIPNRGLGTALVRKAIGAAAVYKCTKIRLVTTNDNINAIRFWQKRGFDLCGVNRGVIDKERALKPEIPLIGENGIPLRHEIEFELDLL